MDFFRLSKKVLITTQEESLNAIENIDYVLIRAKIFSVNNLKLFDNKPTF